MSITQFPEEFGILDPFADEEGPELTPAQITALECLLAGQSQLSAAVSAGRSARWLWTQLHEDGNFRAAYHRAMNARQQQIQTRALRFADAALDALSRIAADYEHRDCLKANLAILKLAAGGYP